jgi:Fe-S cluster assembly protein SufD
MNIHPVPQRTPAEAALVEAFADCLSELPGDGSVMVRRDNALEQVKAGLPTRRIESWHYTDLRRLLTSVPSHDRTASIAAMPPVLAGSLVLPVLNGVSSPPPALPDGVGVERLADKLSDGSFSRALEAQGADDAIGALNAAFVADGYFVDIAAGAAPAAPIELQNLHAGAQSHIRHPVRVGDGASATVVERQSGSGAGFVTSVSNVVVGDGAELRWLIVQDNPDEATHLGQFNAWMGKDARLLLFVMNAGGRLVRQEVRVTTKGEGGEFRLRGINLLAGDTHTDVTMVIDHAAAGTVSTEVVRNIVTGRARGVFQGRINVHQQAQKTDAKLACNTLLLSDDAEFSTKPELEIFADDVQCGHGATVTEIDRNHLFYLMARGIDERTARGLLVKAFVAEVIEELDDEPVVEALEAMLDKWFASHG